MTPEQIEPHLPTVAAGWNFGDWTEPEDRWDAAQRLAEFYAAVNPHEPDHRDPHDIRHGDTWTIRNNRATIIGSNDWPPPAKGTHESDLMLTNHTIIDYGPPIEGLPGTGPDDVYTAALAWSSTE